MKPILSLILIIVIAALCVGCGSAQSAATASPELSELPGNGDAAITLTLD